MLARRGLRERGAELLARLADETTLNDSARAQAARQLVWVRGHQEHAAELLGQIANGTTPN